ncbi:MAG: TIGR03905 family TSCPD domain-containing protein [Bacteroidaceae bacterium]|nr:TIGR03905 family TSCPD domain-containing protein [Bacteroidaceae bacterium]
MKGVFTTRGTCSSQIELEVDDTTHIIHSVAFVGGCHGNTQGISLLVKGQKAEDVINKLQGIRCGMKPTSCPDQLARALTACLNRISEQQQQQ